MGSRRELAAYLRERRSADIRKAALSYVRYLAAGNKDNARYGGDRDEHIVHVTMSQDWLEDILPGVPRKVSKGLTGEETYLVWVRHIHIVQTRVIQYILKELKS